MATDKKTIESYSNYAEQWAEYMRAGKNIAHEYLEKPAMCKKLPNLHGSTVLCVGCGTGEECEHLRSLGAYRVIGIDISSGLIELAKKSYPDCEFMVMDMEHLDLPDDSFDFVYSSLVLHYIDSWNDVLVSIHRVLKKGGKFLFSTHHPVVYGAGRTRTEDERASLLGYIKHLKLGTCTVLGDYYSPRKIDDIWFGNLEISYFHRPMDALMRDILQSPFVLTDFEEPRVDDRAQSVDPVFWEVRKKIPLFVIFELKK
ncbi:MAG: methyltransferase type 11 [uncultured bacterium]|uniref:Methyltransferase type 11 n=1 Tax=Candidatus Wolfebacteria bacterium GW2011_GWC2_39_22 TaxID=1619013 RepID=A0A0G0RGC3_9BACT|nr:MAG: methyltransferase type 11 [uncultured bacterium]KKR12682.1 MAG: Methyltransferase type 11 [Candidatus Wolfebacteria bacterium GW2011_GWC2_39_22]HBI25654.1 hypothetical protein [Candidatus Wolfebacteria bacterium]